MICKDNVNLFFKANWGWLMKTKDVLLTAILLTYAFFITAQPANLIITPSEVHFGEVMTDETRAQLFEFTNLSPVPMEISYYVTADDGSVNLNLVGRERSDSLFFPLLPMETRLVTLTYTPQLPGLWNTLLQVYEHISGTAYIIPVDAINIPAFYVTPESYDFGQIAVGYPFLTDIRIYNPNSFNLELQLKVNYQPGDEGCIELILPGGLRPDSLTTTVSSCETLFVGVQVTPGSYGAHSAGIVVCPYPVQQPAEITYVYFAGEKPVWVPFELSFGTVYINSMTSNYGELISYLNSGIDVSAYAAANPSQVSLTGQGTPGGRNKTRSDSLYFHLEPRTPYQFSVTFMPEQLGAWSDTLIVYDHTNNQTYYVPMSAFVIPLPTLAINPPELNFGNVYQGYEYIQQLQVQNPTDSVLTIGHYVTGDDGSVNLNLIGRDRTDSLHYTINPHETKNLEVRIVLSELGPLSCQLNAYVEQTGELFQTPLNAIGVPPLIITPPVVDFGNVPLNQIRSQLIDLHNGSDSTMTIGHYVTGDDGSVNLNLIGRNRSDSLFYSILPGQNQQVEVEFSPQAEGPWTNIMHVYEHHTGTLFQIPMNAFVEPPLTGLYISPMEVHFGTVCVFDTLYQTFSFTNYSAAPMNIGHYVTGDDGSVNLNLVGRDRTDSLSFTLMPSETKQVQMTAIPHTLGIWSRTLHAGYDNTRNWFDWIVDALVVPNIKFVPPSIDFGEVHQGLVLDSTSSVEPAAPCDSVVQYDWDIRPSHPFSQVEIDLEEDDRADSLHVLQNADDTLNVRIHFTPQTPGPWSDTLVYTELVSGAVYYVPMTAYVLPPQPLVITPLEVHFGNVYLNETRVQQFDFTNNGTIPMQISQYVTGDDGSVDLNLIGRDRADSLYFEILPAQTRSVMMTFTPQTPGAWSADMHAYDHVNGTLYNFTVDSNNLPVMFVSVPSETLVVNAGVPLETYCDVINPNQFPLEITASIEHDDYYSHISFTGLERPDSITVTIQPDDSIRLPILIIPYRPGTTNPDIKARSTLYENVEIKPLRLVIASIRPELDIERNGDDIMLSWLPVPAAIGYRIYACDEPDGEFLPIGIVTETSVLLPSFGIPRKFYRVTTVYPE
jgi:hypothetical protein